MSQQGISTPTSVDSSPCECAYWPCALLTLGHLTLVPKCLVQKGWTFERYFLAAGVRCRIESKLSSVKRVLQDTDVRLSTKSLTAAIRSGQEVTLECPLLLHQDLWWYLKTWHLFSKRKYLLLWQNETLCSEKSRGRPVFAHWVYRCFFSTSTDQSWNSLNFVKTSQMHPVAFLVE